jgi:MOSC domain-containing protein YiiM
LSRSGSGKLAGIFLKRAHGEPMDSQQTAVLEVGRGLIGSAERGGRRQVTLLSQERWTELMQEVGASLRPEMRRANLILSGIDLDRSRGRTLIIGSCRLRIGGETGPCKRMEEAAPGLHDAMREHWGGGAFAEVLDGGPIALGDPVAWE